MRTKLTLLIAIIFSSLTIFSKGTGLPDSYHKLNTLSPKLVINNNDTLVFDLANATLTATYIDLPIYAISDDVLFGIDYSIQFNQSKLTYSTTIDLLPSDPTILSAAFFNPTTLKLKYTCSTLQSLPSSSPFVYITKIRFMLSAPCIQITAADFSNIDGYLNGVISSDKVSNLDFSQFIPSANYSTGPTCSNASVQFSNTSTVQNGLLTNWAWTFGNGTSTLQAPSNSYTSTGIASATLIATTAVGCKDTIVNSFTIHAPPVSSFSYSFDCIKDSVFFTNTSSTPSGSLAGSFWNFGEQGGTSNSVNPVYHYNASGFFTVSLIATSSFSCSGTNTLVVDLSNKVAASFTNTSVNQCLGTTINFNDGSTYALSPISAWAWNFGDGNISSQQNTSHTYTTAGTFTVTLISSANDGCKGSITKILTIDPPPVVQFTVSNTTGCAFAASSFTDLSTTPATSTYTWSFGDGGTSNSQNPSYSYSVVGVYPIKLVVITPAGCSDSLTKPAYLTINNTPVGSFSVSNACIQTNILFTNYVTIATGSIVSWQWNFGDGNNSALQTPVNSYSVSGNYSVTLSAVSDLGCIGTYSRVIILSQKPTINFSYTSGLDCSGETLSFNNQTTPANGPSFVWRFGDGTFSLLQSPIHTYLNSGFYAIKLIAINPGGCADSITKPYTVALPPPVTAIFTESVVANGSILFTNQSLNFLKSKWNFGDNTNSLLNNPLHTFPEISNYSVCLTVYNSLNCPDSLCKEVFTGISRIVAIPSSFTPNDDNHNDVLKVRGGPFAEIEFQIFNEWGNLIFSSTAQEVGWDGNFNGEAQPVGVYEYVLRGRTLEDKKINLYGVVNLVR